MHINSELIINADERKFEEILVESDLPVLVDFWAPWCAACRIQSAVIEEAAPSYRDKIIFVKVNIGEAEQVAKNMRIRSVPTLVIFKNTAVVDVRAGLTSRKSLDRMLGRALGKSLWQRLFGKK